MASRSSGRSRACGWRHGYTYSGHAASSAVALANLDIIEREGLLDEASRLETTLAARLGHRWPISRGSWRFACGTGALAAVQLADPPTAMALAKRLRSFGVATRAVGAGGIQVSPPFVMTDDQVGDLADAITAALAA